ncbi:MAG: phosphotransferase [Bacteroidota bacterium]
MYVIENELSTELVGFLQENGIIEVDEIVKLVEKPGEGNMNLVLRLITSKRSFILKQSRNFVQKYPSIPAPIQRILVEAEFYKTVTHHEFLKSKMPELLGFYPEQYLLVLEDLGQNSDFTSIYQPNSVLIETDVLDLVSYLNQLHSIDIEQYPSNDALKLLNYFHIFKFPFEEINGFDLDTIQKGLADISTKYKIDRVLKAKVDQLGEIYLANGERLLHGDFYPGSWLKTDSGIKIIDPEFGYLGRAEFDLGVFTAHLVMAKKAHLIPIIAGNYKKTGQFSDQLMNAFAGVEIMRRLLGVAQLPLHLSISEKTEMLEWAFQQIENYEN